MHPTLISSDNNGAENRARKSSEGSTIFSLPICAIYHRILTCLKFKAYLSNGQCDFIIIWLPIAPTIASYYGNMHRNMRTSKYLPMSDDGNHIDYTASDSRRSCLHVWLAALYFQQNCDSGKGPTYKQLTLKEAVPSWCTSLPRLENMHLDIFVNDQSVSNRADSVQMMVFLGEMKTYKIKSQIRLTFENRWLSGSGRCSSLFNYHGSLSKSYKEHGFHLRTYSSRTHENVFPLFAPSTASNVGHTFSNER